MKNGLRTVLQEASNQYSATMTSALRNMHREDVGWEVLGGSDGTSDSAPLSVIKEHAVRARRLVSLNPLVKRGVGVRNAYMWADMPDLSDINETVRERNDATVFSTEARVRDEAALCTDGMVVYLVNKATKIAAPVPIKRVRAVARAEDATDESDLYAFLIDPVPISAQLGEQDTKPKWYIVDGKKYSEVSNKEGYVTERGTTVVYAAVNRQAGEQWGKPDLMGAVYWAQAYKEYLEAAHNMAKALARIAYKVQSMNARQQSGVIQQMSGAVGVGGTASLGYGQDLTAVGKSSAGLDFSAASPLASMVSSSLDVPLSVLLTDGSAGGRQGAETALEDPTFKAFDLRRGVHRELLKRLCVALSENNADLRMVALNNDLVQRRMQSIVLGKNLGALWPEEVRALTLDVLRPANAKGVDDLPPEPEPVATDETSPGAMSDGTNANRDGDETVA